jgi:hypothetical protein
LALDAMESEQAGKADDYGPISEIPDKVQVDKAEHGPFLATVLVVSSKSKIGIHQEILEGGISTDSKILYPSS